MILSKNIIKFSRNVVNQQWNILSSTRRFSVDSTHKDNNHRRVTHLTEDNAFPNMVDVSEKTPTKRIAHARGYVVIPNKVVGLIKYQDKEILSKKGPVFTTATVAGVMAVKNTPNLIPFCHPIQIEDCSIKFEVENPFDDGNSDVFVRIDCVVQTTGKTGVEMEAMQGVSQAALCIYDMMKSLSHDIVIKDIKLISKSGGKSDFVTHS